MKYILDTHLLLWAANASNELPNRIRHLLNDESLEPFFSAASLWEIAIKSSLGREDFQVDTRILRRGLIDSGYKELAISSQHAVFIQSLPAIHKDPFDRILIAQATVEGITLLTSDAIISQYEGPIEFVTKA